MGYGLKIFIGLLLLASYIFSKQLVDERYEIHKQTEEIRYLPTPRLAKLLSFGFEPAMADIFWIEAINYQGMELGRKDRHYTYLSSYADLILALDPYFATFYDWAGTAFIYTGLEVTRPWIVDSLRYSRQGVMNLAQIYRYDPRIIQKVAFNYAFEAKAFDVSVPIFAFGGRVNGANRDLLLVGAAYAQNSEAVETNNSLKTEYLGYVAFEAQSRDQLNYAIHILSSPSFNSRTSAFVRNLRLASEKDESMKKLVAKRLEENPFLERGIMANNDLSRDSKLENILKVDFTRTWLPPELHVLFSL